MSLHPVAGPTRAELLAIYEKPVPKALGTASAALAIIGALVFLIGLFVAPDRAWSAYHFNWLFFTALSSGGVMFVAVQRITTARWSRPIIRFMEGYVAFLPVALVLLAISMLLGRGHIFPWTHEAPPVPEKATWYNPAYVTTRDLLAFLIITALSLWYVYT